MNDTVAPWALDQMSRKGVAKFLTRYIDTTERIRVLNINSPWGSGKTFFLENWMAEQKPDRACVYFNAWESDFTGDAFVSLVAAIREQLSEQITGEESFEAVKNFTTKASKTLVAATPAIAKGVIKKFTGFDIELIQDIIEKDDLADAAEKAVEKLIESNQDTLNSIRDFKKTFSRLIKLAIQSKDSDSSAKPVYIFIDELDRCRPTFAIELLERIKHLFDVGDCKFIIATDTAQLGHAIKAVYGSGFESSKYLKRFFDAEFSLNNSDIVGWVQANLKILSSIKTLELGHYRHFNSRMPHHEPNTIQPDADTITSGETNLDDNQVIFVALAKTFKCELRELDKIVHQIFAVALNSSETPLHFFWAAYLVFLKDDAPELFDEVINRNVSLAMEKIRAKYPPKKLYFRTSNISIHDIFEFYASHIRSGQRAATAAADRRTGTEYRYIDCASTYFYNHFDALKRYPKLVELAHSIE